MLQGEKCGLENMDAHLEDARSCVSESLMEMHVKAIRRHAALLAGRVATLRRTGPDQNRALEGKAQGPGLNLENPDPTPAPATPAPDDERGPAGPIENTTPSPATPAPATPAPA